MSYPKAGAVTGVPAAMHPVYHSRGTRASDGALRAEGDASGPVYDQLCGPVCIGATRCHVRELKR